MPLEKTIIILGPTATGKTKFSIKLAEESNGEIISADSMQVYRGMDIGTAKPPLEERKNIPHHLIDIINPDEEWTVSDFIASTKKIIPEIIVRGKTPLIVGGTGLYLWALINGFSFPIVSGNEKIRENLEKLTIEELYTKLNSVDKQSAEKIHQNDRKRIIRALEVYELTGSPITQMQKMKKSDTTETANIIGLNLSREQLYEKINRRADNMIKKGLIDEVEGLLAKGYSKNLRSFQALGYKEVVEYLEGRWTKEEMIEELKKRTRNFARRQMTWFKRFKNVKWESPE
ncbi:tRNA (adenosine(37)-N6)-dimethylallyltransferase MiaA [candidate division WOR-1 bacterium RIFOXYD2_FULL_36_8]|uniref:tRNA dimethylallyltransferase n=1 Tax=candidate division WOR-1 bacterium RIFOXYB2_FULL_36_35 TaxID=1802578 RepID=A0A1F4S3K3_UNCSA|nr:MAG: tRNA (adenosine(37)-N6)-dimethylallyltransferase MiaA [candidate division WOR-1 bacterium RIFOXYA2_FULL_36_21]OGC14990.1 MAG: tRNA (adenosine(37)-N6)-dimethylallyltransferase MiaA [candidate division WOR-1 bacterium RIFOXYB2_FULL_36_35]OGC18697.1 MAG: tRNA (adenosine(37)-N6)-dimethylallyltransferase MiaA [candidate division WOR-1 bacterium RIFOXYA12_FULL_36_13]OGC37431.1 MAG: tRNA (adenosine(37)-N6)-dimethylallyltransferase MiaA [candidate division WOR-1 bacterium RIFOXYD2_FULL_36_8]